LEKPRGKIEWRTPSKSKYQCVEHTNLKRENPVLNHEWRTLSESKYLDVLHTYLKRENAVVNHKEDSKAKLCTCRLNTNN
jgi:hypothetical protein